MPSTLRSPSLWQHLPPDRKQQLRTQLRAELARRQSPSPLAFGQHYLPHLLTGPLSPLHHDLDSWHAAALTQPPGRKTAIAAPRGHGKTTAGVEVPALWHVARCTRRYIVIVSDTASQAEQRIATITTEAEQNEQLRAGFPHLRPAIDQRGQPVAWRDNELAFACGCRIRAVGAGKAVRGAKVREQRPDLLILDDLEDEDSVASPHAIERRLHWLLRVALGLAGPKARMDVLWVGTIISRGALLNAATGAALDEGQQRPAWSSSWHPIVYRAELPGPKQQITVELEDGYQHTALIGPSMWAGHLTRHDLAVIHGSIGAVAYAAEYLADPASDETRMLTDPIPAHYLNPDVPPLQRVIRRPDGRLVPVAQLVRAAALDPQYADEGAKDPDLAAIAVAGQHGGDTYLLDAWVGRDRHGQAGRLVNMAARWGCYAAAVETTGAQIVTADQAWQLARIPIVPRTPTQGKVARALSLAVRTQQQRVFALPDAEPLLPYLALFPAGRYDDPVDAAVYAVDLAVAGAAGQSGGQAPLLAGERRPILNGS